MNTTIFKLINIHPIKNISQLEEEEIQGSHPKSSA